MTTPILRFENNDRAAHAVFTYLDNARPSPQRFTLRPFNRFDTAFTAWWLVPSTEWPAYRFGKLAFLRGEGAREMAGYMKAGYYVEHGFDVQKVADMATRSQLMTDKWRWHDLVRAAGAGELDPLVQTVAERSGRPVVANLDMWAVNHPPALDEEPVAPDDWYELVVAPAGATDQEAWRPDGRLLRPLRGSTGIAEMAQRLEALDGLGYYWLDLSIGVWLRYGDQETGAWGAEELWRDVFHSWNAWVR